MRKSQRVTKTVVTINIYLRMEESLGVKLLNDLSLCVSLSLSHSLARI